MRENGEHERFAAAENENQVVQPKILRNYGERSKQQGRTFHTDVNPLMAESEYLRQAVGEPLAKCLTDVVLHRPNDPIEYIALWLYKHSENVKNELQRAKEAEQLAKEIEEQKIANEMMIQLALEEEQQHQKEAEQAAKQLEEAERLQMHHTDTSVDKHEPVGTVLSATDRQGDNEEEEEETEEGDEEEEEETVTRVQSNTSQIVTEPNVDPDQSGEMKQTSEQDVQRDM